ncbi:MAG TPA: hypothetical protein VHT30_05590 [Acidimicrobiales bacterium]|nr:hypothetical protein [Acidimicrobiales bacterium]
MGEPPAIPPSFYGIADQAARAARNGSWSPAEQADLESALLGLRATPDLVPRALSQPTPDPWHQLVVRAGADCQASVFVLPAGAAIPLHDHPNMTVLCTMLSGHMRVHRYQWVDRQRGLATDLGVAEMGPTSVARLLPDPGELHEITALTDCAFFDVCAPYYDPDSGRPCRYFSASPVAGDVARLTEMERCVAVPADRHAIVLVEARGAAVHFQEDANLSLVQAALLARKLLATGYQVQILLILDAGQSIEEYSVLCHRPPGELQRLRAGIHAASHVAQARRTVVAQIREEYLPVRIQADPVNGMEIEDGLFHAALLSRIVGVNQAVVDRMASVCHPLVDRSAMEAYEELLHRAVGRPYLDLEATVARTALESAIGDAGKVDISTISRPPAIPSAWLADPLCARVVASDLGIKAGGGDHTSFESRLIGLFTTVDVPGETRPYFNSPTCCRYEHGRARLIARDRFGILALSGSERMTFDDLRTLIAQQSDGTGCRPLAVKYPYTASYLGASVGDQASALTEQGEVLVVFVEGISDSINPGTGGLLDRCLTTALSGSPVRYRRLSAPPGSRQLLPSGPGGLPLIHGRLQARFEARLSDADQMSGLSQPAKPRRAQPRGQGTPIAAPG